MQGFAFQNKPRLVRLLPCECNQGFTKRIALHAWDYNGCCMDIDGFASTQAIRLIEGIAFIPTADPLPLAQKCSAVTCAHGLIHKVYFMYSQSHYYSAVIIVFSNTMNISITY